MLPSERATTTAALQETPAPSQSNGAERCRALEARLAELQGQHGRLNRALFEAEQVQRKLCAPRQLCCGSFEIASEIFPVRYLSGDFYDVVNLGETVALAVGDIAGKGVAASLWFAHLISLIRAHVGRCSPEAMEAINRDLCQLETDPPLASLFLGWLNPTSGKLLYCNAGHPPALVLRDNGATEALRRGGLVLGAFPGAVFETGSVLLHPDDTLIGYSDGIIECRNDKDEEFGAQGLLKAARRARNRPAKEMLFSILGAVQDFAGACQREDDFTLMVARRSGA